MDCKNIQSLAPVSLRIAFLFIAAVAFGQDARAVLDLNNADIVALVQSVMDQGFPADKSDQMTMLIINRSQVVIPAIETKIEEVINSQSPSTKFVDTASEMIAYAGDEQALRAISKLIAIDAKRFEVLVKRALDNSLNYRNPFTLVYRAFEIGDDRISQQAASWSEAAISTVRMKKLWGLAMLERYGKVPGDGEWAKDPIASRLPVTMRNQLKESVTNFASESLDRHDKQ